MLWASSSRNGIRYTRSHVLREQSRSRRCLWGEGHHGRWGIRLPLGADAAVGWGVVIGFHYRERYGSEKDLTWFPLKHDDGGGAAPSGGLGGGPDNAGGLLDGLKRDEAGLYLLRCLIGGRSVQSREAGWCHGRIRGTSNMTVTAIRDYACCGGCHC